MKITIHKEIEVTCCNDCPYYKLQKSYDGQWYECEHPFCILDGHIERASEGRGGMKAAVEKYGLKKLNDEFGKFGLLFETRTHYLAIRKDKVVSESVEVRMS